LALQKGQNAEALTQLAALVETAPDFSAGHNLYAELLAAAGDATGAARHRWLGRETLRYREADDPWLDELQAWCYDYDRLCVIGTLQLQAGREDQSRKFFERAIAVRPHASRAYELLADLFLKRDDATAARDLLEEALPRLNETQSAAFFSTLSLTYRRLQQPVEAARAARLGLARLGDQPELLDALGLALADSGQHTEALVAWQAALTQNPRDAGMNYHRALSLLALQRLDEALDALELSLTLQPTYLPTLLLRGEIELEAAHLELAEKYLRPAFASHPEDAQARRFLAEWHLRTGAKAEENGDAAGAERNYRAGLIVDDNHAGLLLRLGAFYLVHQRPAEAIVPLSRHHDLLPANAPGCLFLGQAYAITGERNKAREILSAGIKLADQAGDPTTATHCRRIMKQL
jgi:HemY protein